MKYLKYLRYLTFVVLLAICGFALSVVALLKTLSISGTELAIHDQPWRSIALGGGVMLIGISIAIHLKDQKTKGEFAKSSVPGPTEHFLFTLDERSSESFPSLIVNAKRICCLSRTGVNLLNNYQRELVRAANNGCKIDILMADPTSPACQFLYGNNQKAYKNNALSSVEVLRNLERQAQDALRIHVTKHAPTMGILNVENEREQENFVRVQVYFLHSRVGRDRPHFKIAFHDKWYNAFKEEFEKAWADSRKWDPQAIINHFENIHA